MTERTHFVYEAYDADGICLYVGCTGDPQGRWRAHMTGGGTAHGWFDPFVVKWCASGPYPKAVALAIEKERISVYQPIFNAVSAGNRRGARRLIGDYLAYHGVAFEPHPQRNRPVLVRTRRGPRRLRAVAS